MRCLLPDLVVLCRLNSHLYVINVVSVGSIDPIKSVNPCPCSILVLVRFSYRFLINPVVDLVFGLRFWLGLLPDLVDGCCRFVIVSRILAAPSLVFITDSSVAHENNIRLAIVELFVEVVIPTIRGVISIELQSGHSIKPTGGIDARQDCIEAVQPLDFARCNSRIKCSVNQVGAA